MPFQRFLVALAVSLLLTSCCSVLTQSFCCAPAECSAAKEGFARYEPILEALESYRRTHGEYPFNWEDLASEYPSVAMNVGKNDRLTYVREGNGMYNLEFTYYGPGVNRCWRSSESVEWKCTGYF